ncbi:MAG: transcriptional regulator, partial [Acidobacteriota bacterium]
MATPARPRRFYQFGPFRLDGLSRVLLRDSELIPLSPAIVETLLVLIENRGSVVVKEELLKAVWPDTVVEEGNLTHNISVLRKTLGEGPGEQRYIQTVPKRGYRFVATVSEVEELPPPGPATAAKPALVTQARARRPVWLILASVVAALSCAAAAFYLWLRPGGSASLNNAAFTQLTDQPGQESYPSLAPDGNS